jgi:hypothetical protein
MDSSQHIRSASAASSGRKTGYECRDETTVKEVTALVAGKLAVLLTTDALVGDEVCGNGPSMKKLLTRLQDSGSKMLASSVSGRRVQMGSKHTAAISTHPSDHTYNTVLGNCKYMGLSLGAKTCSRTTIVL